MFWQRQVARGPCGLGSRFANKCSELRHGALVSGAPFFDERIAKRRIRPRNSGFGHGFGANTGAGGLVLVSLLSPG